MYYFKAKDRKGSLHRGKIEAESKMKAVLKLNQKYPIILSLRKESIVDRTWGHLGEKLSGMELKAIGNKLNNKAKTIDFKALTQKTTVQKQQQDDEKLKELIQKEIERKQDEKEMQSLLDQDVDFSIEEPVTEGERVINDIKQESSVNEKVEKKVEKRNDKKRLFYRIKNSDLLQFTNQMSLLLKSGVPLLKSLAILKTYNTNPKFQAVIGKIMLTISRGNQLSVALKEHPKVFPDIYVSMIEIGETSGNLPGVLDDLLVFLEMKDTLKKEMVKTSTYPIFVLVFLLFGLVGASLFLVPRFQEIFQTMGVELPTLTKLVFYISDHILLILSLGFSSIFFLFLLTRKVKSINETIYKWNSQFIYKVPVVGKVVLNSHLYQLSSSLGLMLRNGVQLNHALQKVTRLINNYYMKEELRHIRTRVEKGGSLGEAFSDHKYFPKTFISSIASGEISGRIGVVLTIQASHYQKELKSSIDRLTSKMQPASISLLALLIVPFILSIYLAISQIMNANF